MCSVTWRRLADQDEGDAGGLEVRAGAMQLHRVVAAVHSAVVAQPDESDRAVAPQVAQPDLLAVVVQQHDVRQRVRPVWRTGLLALLRDAEHGVQCTVPP